MSPSISLQALFPVRDATVEATYAGSEAILVLPARGQVKVLNEVGAHVWSLADGTRDVAAIVAAICEAYEVAPHQAEADTLAFIAELESRGLVRLADGPIAPAAP